jgi:hypothetical protein
MNEFENESGIHRRPSACLPDRDVTRQLSKQAEDATIRQA